MKRRFGVTGERVCFGFLIALPWVILLAWICGPLPTWVHPWLRNASLGGVTDPKPPVALSWPHLADRTFQDYIEWEATQRLFGREALIRWTNELHFRLFHETASANSKLSVGRQDTLFENDYLQEYFLERGAEPGDLSRKARFLASRLRQLQESCRLVGTGFVLVISPSKAATYPELTPTGWTERYDRRPRFIDHFVEEMHRQGLSYVDGRIPTLQCRNFQGWDVGFPRGGTHWGDLGAFLTASEALSALGNQSLPLAALEPKNPTLQTTPVPGDDGDLLYQMNLALPWSYPCAYIEGRPVSLPPSQKRSLVVVGSSFSGWLTNFWATSGQFSEIDFYFYHFHLKRCFLGVSRTVNPQEATTPFIPRPRPIDFRRDILAADAVILELNESSTGEYLLNLCRHIPAPDSQGTKQSFRYEGFLPLPWEQEIEFARPTLSTNQPNKLLLQVPNAEQDVRLGLLLSAEGPEQSLHWDVDEDGSVGRIAVAGSKPTWYTIRIPRDRIGADGHLVVSLSPERVMNLARLRATPVEQASTFLPCPWGEDVSFATSGLVGFTAASDKSLESTGPEAAISLELPRLTPGRVELRALIGAFSNPKVLPTEGVKLYANGHFAGSWRFNSEVEGWRNIEIPEAWIAADRHLKLEFSIWKKLPGPQNDKAADPYRVGLRLRRLVVKPVS